MTRAMVGKAVQLPNEVRWTGGEDINVGKDNGEGTATNVSAFGEGRKGGKNQAVIQREGHGESQQHQCYHAEIVGSSGRCDPTQQHDSFHVEMRLSEELADAKSVLF